MKALAYQQGEELHVVIPNYQAGYTIESIKDNYHESVEIDIESVPSRHFRNAWTLENNAVTIDVPKAKLIAHDIRREKRTEYMKGNIALIEKDAMGIPLKQGESASQAKLDNAKYKADIDDPMQAAIDAASNESEILTALGLL